MQSNIMQLERSTYMINYDFGNVLIARERINIPEYNANNIVTILFPNDKYNLGSYYFSDEAIDNEKIIEITDSINDRDNLQFYNYNFIFKNIKINFHYYPASESLSIDDFMSKNGIIRLFQSIDFFTNINKVKVILDKFYNIFKLFDDNINFFERILFHKDFNIFKTFNQYMLSDINRLPFGYMIYKSTDNKQSRINFYCNCNQSYYNYYKNGEILDYIYFIFKFFIDRFNFDLWYKFNPEKGISIDDIIYSINKQMEIINKTNKIKLRVGMLDFFRNYGCLYYTEMSLDGSGKIYLLLDENNITRFFTALGLLV